MYDTLTLGSLTLQLFEQIKSHVTIADFCSTAGTVQFAANEGLLENELILFKLSFPGFEFEAKCRDGMVFVLRNGLYQHSEQIRGRDRLHVAIQWDVESIGCGIAPWTGDWSAMNQHMRAVRTPYTIPPLELNRMLRAQNQLIGTAHKSSDDVFASGHKPFASRKVDVQSKLAYTKHRHVELMNTLLGAKQSANDPAFLVHTCADIISTARECFDYLGQDIIEGHIIPNTKNQRILKTYAEGKLKVYFPYYAAQVTKPDSIFHDLATIAPPLHQYLLDFTNSIATNAHIPSTLFNYKMLADVRDMVNEKKHDKLIAIVSEAEGEYLVENSSFQMIIPIKVQKGWSHFSVEPGTKVSRVAEYRFAYNDQEVGKFCLFATNATERVIEGFYSTHFA